MATSELERPRIFPGATALDAREEAAGPGILVWVLSFLSSLKLTVVLFSFAIALVFLGTLAQKDQDVWQVVNDTYFRVWFARVDLLVFQRLAQLFFKGAEWNLPYGFYFPGGKLIGLALLVNLSAAHAVRFKIAAEGQRLWLGLATIVAGLVFTFLVIQSGINQAVESELSARFCDVLWQVFRGSLAVLALGSAYAAIFFRDRMRRTEWWILTVIATVIAGVAIWLLADPNARVGNSGIRILWQLAKGLVPGVVLLVGCAMVFRKRAGIVVLHGGIALIMLTELFTAMQAVESRMQIFEGQTVDYSDDIRTTELAVIDRSNPEHDQVTVVPASRLVANLKSDEPIDDDALPFKIRVHRWLQNSQVRQPQAADPNPATAGFGLRQVADELPAATGVGEGAQVVDSPSAYIELISKKTGDSLGTFLASYWLLDQPVEVDGRSYDLSLRFKRLYHPYSLTLEDFTVDHYTGTNQAKTYKSLVTFKDPRHNVDREVLIWMNNPLRYAGTTFYQADFDKERERYTILQVVENPSWMTPYVACMLVGTGMLAHFGSMLVRFLRRRADEDRFENSVGTGHNSVVNGSTKGRKSRQIVGGAHSAWSFSSPMVWFPALVVLIFAGYIAGKTRLPESGPSEMRIYDFGALPLAYQGRVKPYDTLARNSLQILSGRQELAVTNERGEVIRKEPAIRWLLDVLAGAPSAADHPVFRIENLEVIDALGLEQRPLFWRYSLNEISEKRGELDRQIELALKTPKEDRTLEQHKFLQLRDKRDFYMILALAFRPPPLSTDREQFAESFRQTQSLIATLQQAQAPHAVPPQDATTRWTMLVQAELEALRDQITQKPVNPSTVALSAMLNAYARGDVTMFNKQLSDYRSQLAKYEQSLEENAPTLESAGVAKSEILSQPRIRFEVFFNQFSPFYYAMVLYLVAFLFGVLSWIIWRGPMRRASIALLWFTFLLHTFALWARMEISGRPPVTNLYTTAIFIGWGCVLLSLVFEAVYKLGLGNIVAAVLGFVTLFLAYNLSLDGDTFKVLEPVLDTQFWLATHVVTINLGYATTYVAGAFGVAYLLLGHVFPVFDSNDRHVLSRIIYGTVCFAIFFSFIGTVLGGLWADDSWGRFWGWDPKENGALMIVIWNALVLHARWGGMVKGRGLATLAVAGTIITTWSYFGVNELGVGLHAYGASESSTSMWLLAYAVGALTLVGLGLMPERWFEAAKERSAPGA